VVGHGGDAPDQRDSFMGADGNGSMNDVRGGQRLGHAAVLSQNHAIAGRESLVIRLADRSVIDSPTSLEDL